MDTVTSNLTVQDMKAAGRPKTRAAAHCKRRPLGTDAATLREDHKARMVARRRKQFTRERGFTAIPNERINKAIALQMAVIAADALERKLDLSPADIESRAVQNVARTLPPPAMVRGLHRRPSRSDDPSYRKGIWPAAKVRG